MLIRNFSNGERSIYVKAVKEYKRKTGDKSLYIDPSAFIDGNKIKGFSALRSKEKKMFQSFGIYSMRSKAMEEIA